MPSHLLIFPNIFKDGDEDDEDEEEDEAGLPEGYEEEEEEEEEEDEAGSELGEGEEEVGLSYLMKEEIQVNRHFLHALKINLGIRLSTIESNLCRNLQVVSNLWVFMCVYQSFFPTVPQLILCPENRKHLSS